MKFELIPAGEFDMGSQKMPYDEDERYYDEGPVHQVIIEEDFYIGIYEVTQKQWHEIMGNNPSYFKSNDLPVEQVSWNEVQEFIKRFNEIEDTDKYRLPSEAEWEYAYRAGTTTKYSFGDDNSILNDYAWYGENSDGKTHPVGQKIPNPYGLYDTHGNVWEWVQDRYHDSYNDAPSDGSAWVSGNDERRVARGGSYSGIAADCRSTDRGIGYPDECYRYLGFRLLKEI
jgi:formylglycine-generating enzyme required for sulfatase activity